MKPQPDTLYLDCFSGISGDMFVGAMIDVGVPPSVIEWELGKVEAGAMHLHFERESRNGIEGVWFKVHEGGSCSEKGHAGHHGHHQEHAHSHEHCHSHSHSGHEHGCGHEHSHSGGHHQDEHGRTFAQIRSLIEGSSLTGFVKTRAVSIFQRIAEAEGKIHGVPPERVGFHEVGALDSIVDIIAACVAIEHLGQPRVLCSRLVEGSGFVRCAHGTFPVPAPATLEILRAASLSLAQEEDSGERITPTGAAIVAEFSLGTGPMPEMTIKRIGYGIGSRQHKSRPNVLRAVLGSQESAGGFETDSVISIETNLDDATPEHLGAAVEAILTAGALDVTILPAQMKKSRPGHLLVALCKAGEERCIAEVVMRQTGTFGVRMARMERFKLARKFRDVETKFGVVRVKEAHLGGERLHAAPEYESCIAVAKAAGAGFKAVFDEALAAALREG